jgi:ABC-type Mn2+/Zn2+ transport system permease subunit
MISALLVIGLWLSVNWTGRPRRLLIGGILIGLWSSNAAGTLASAVLEYYLPISE